MTSKFTNALRLCLLAILSMCYNVISAQFKSANALEIIDAKGQSTYFQLSDDLKISINSVDALIEINSEGQTPANISFSDVRQCNHVYHSFGQSAISNIDPDAEIQFDGHLLKLNVPHAELYTVSGICLQRYAAQNQAIVIDLDCLDCAVVLILHYGKNKSLKIKK